MREERKTTIEVHHIREVDDYSPMDGPSLKDRPTVKTIDGDELLAEHLRDSNEHGCKNFMAEPLRTLNPTEKIKLPPEEMVDRTFLMPPQRDGSRVRAKIIEQVQHMRDLSLIHI